MDIYELQAALDDFHYSCHHLDDSESSFKIMTPEELIGFFPDIDKRTGFISPTLSGGELTWMPLVALFGDGVPIGYMEFRLDVTPSYEQHEVHFCLEYLYLNSEHRGKGLFSEFIKGFADSLFEYSSPWFEGNNTSLSHFVYSAEYISIEGRRTGNKLLDSIECSLDSFENWSLSEHT